MKSISQKIESHFHNQYAPEPGRVVGYASMIEYYHLKMPLPSKISLTSEKRRNYTKDGWNIYSSRTRVENTLYGHLVFALKYEGINLLFFKNLFEKLNENEITSLIQLTPTGIYSRKLWFLFEWLFQKHLPIGDLNLKNYELLVDEKLQFAITNGENSPRHRIINNLPGTVDFCPLIHKSELLSHYMQKELSSQLKENLAPIHKDVLRRASSFLMLKDSRASFTIEGEPAKNKRTDHWAKAIGEAGINPLSHKELSRLQTMVILDPAKIHMGYRNEGGFIGEHDRTTAYPIPDHISARPEDVLPLMGGLLETYKRLLKHHFDPVLSASMIAFGFVFIHPFVDGNGRIHRYLIHHILSIMGFSEQGIVFPISAAILNHINDYQIVLESYSHPLLDYVEWEETDKHNVRVTNETIDYYRYFDATKMAEFLFAQIEETIISIIPDEINYLQNYDEFVRRIERWIDLPELGLLATFLGQNKGKLSQQKRVKFFNHLTDNEIQNIEKTWQEIFA